MRELKATDKITQKMTRDGAVSENLATGEVEHISSREPETELSASSEESAGAAADLALRAAEHHEKKSARKAEKADTQAVRDGSAARQRPSSRLQFTEEERADPALGKYIDRSDRAADRLDAAKAAVPVKPPGKEHGNPLFAVVGAVGMCVNGHACGTVGNDVCGLWESRRLFHRAVNICFPSAERPFSTFSSCKMVENVLCVALLRDKMYNKCG